MSGFLPYRQMQRCDSSLSQSCVLLHFVALERTADSLLLVLVRLLGVATSNNVHSVVVDLRQVSSASGDSLRKSRRTWQVTCEAPAGCGRLR